MATLDSRNDDYDETDSRGARVLPREEMERVLPAHADMAFSVKRRRVQPITFSIGGRRGDGSEDPYVYEFTPPKNVVMSMGLVERNSRFSETEAMQGLFDWLNAGLSDEDADRIVDRLKDPEDDFDVPDLTDIIQSLQERAAGRPSTSR